MSKRARGNLSYPIVETLKKRVLNWEYLPGQRLTEAELCDEFQVSRSPVRDALQALATIGLVEKKAYSGYLVVQPKSKEVRWLYDLRLALELFAIEQLANRRVVPKSITRLKKSWSKLMMNGTKSDATLAKLDRDFHETLVEALGNELLLNQLQEVNDRLSGLRILDFSSPQRLENTCREHLDILDAIESQEPERARRALKNNITQSKNAVERILSLAPLEAE